MFLYLTLLLYEISATLGSGYNLDLREDAGIDSVIRDFGNLACTSYSLAGLEDCCKINSVGFLQVGQTLDREHSNSYSGTLQCTLDVPTRLQIYEIFISIVDVNDNSPEFSQPTQSLTVDETSTVPSQQYPLVGATDKDSKENSVVRYELMDDTDKFQVQSGTWSGGTLSLSLIIIKKLDYDSGDRSFTLTIKAYDSEDQSATMTLSLTVSDINDNKPEFEATTYSGSVPEDAGTQTVVLTVKATDADSGNNGDVVYSLVGDSLPFAVKDNGDIIVTRALDRETHASYTFLVTAQDRGTVPRQGSVSVVVEVADVNDNEPVIVSPTKGETVQLRENLPIGSIVCKVQISDDDSGDNSKLTVSIKGSYSARFKYVVKQGDIGQIVTTVVLDREETELYTLIINAQDNGTPIRSKEVQFNLQVLDDNDNEPYIDNCDRTITVPENTVGPLFEVEASDADVGRNALLVYDVVDTGRFSVDDTGLLYLKTPFDYEVEQSSTLSVVVSDNGTTPLTTTCDYTLQITDVNDNPPLLRHPGLVTVKEDVPIGSTVVTLSATDKDTHDTLHYFLLTPSDVFSVHQTSGAVVNDVLLDRETRDTYTLDCVVYDAERIHNDTIWLQIEIEDVSDTEPVFLHTPYLLDMSDSAPLDTVVAKVEAFDGDLSDVLRFSISSSYFGIGATSGEIRVSSALKDVSTSPLNSEIRVTDGTFTVSTNLRVNVFKDDGRGPIITQKSGSKLSETCEVGSTAGECTGSSSSPVSYRLSWGPPSEDYKTLFAIDSVTGVISTAWELDYEQYDAYLLTCTVTNVHGHSTDAAITVRVEGSNEFAPKFDKSFFFFDTVDYVDSEKVIGKVVATDADRGNDGILQFYLVSNQTGWEIKRGTGEIIQLKDQAGNRRKRSTGDVNRSKRSGEASSTFHNVRLIVEVRDSPVDEATHMSATATVDISVYPYEGDNGQIILIGSAAGGGLLLMLLVIFIIFIVVRRRKSRSGSKELTYVNPTAVTDKEGRNITTDGGYHSSDLAHQQIVLTDLSGYSDKVRVNGLHNTYSRDELGPGYKEAPLYETVDTAYPVSSPPPGYLDVRDKLVPHKMSVSTVLSDMRNDVQISAIPHRLAGSMTHSTSYESVHVFGSEGGGEGDAAIDAHSLFNKLSEIDDDISVINKAAHFLGDHDSAFSSLGSSNGEITTPYHTEYLQDWKPAFQSVGTICEGMLRNKQFAYKSNRSTSRDPSVENNSPNQNAGLVSRDVQSTNRNAGGDSGSTAASSCGQSREGSAENIISKPISSLGTHSPAQSFSSTNL